MIIFCKKCNADTERYATGRCKKCVKDHSQSYREKNPEKVKKSSAAYREEKQDQVKARTAEWRKKNPEKAKECTVAWRKSNPEKVKSTSTEWRKNNKGSVRVIAQNRRARTRKVGGSLSSDLSKKLFGLQKGKCACCGHPLGDNYHLDHIMPIALGGPNTDDNIQLLRQQCNNQKHSKHPIDFMQSRGFLL